MRKSGLRAVLSSWQLVLLGTTGVVLSIASGWTTWDGMRNFTKEPLLSLMITFGIQGVMLIAAWMIGESFAAEKDRPQTNRWSTGRRLGVITGSGLGIAVFVGIGLLLMAQSGILDLSEPGAGALWGAGTTRFNLAVVAILLAALLLVSGRDIIGGYLRSMRVIVRNAVLWVMFLACMATSVFFSFDSLFSTIFSESERHRAAELRTRSEVSGIVNDIVEITARRQLEQRTAFLNSREWLDYARTLNQLTEELQAAPAVIEEYLREGALSEQEAVISNQAKLSLIETETAQLSRLKEHLSRLAGQERKQVAQLETAVDTLNRQIFEKDREIIVKTAEAEAEASGIGVTSRPGRGPKYRELTDQQQRLEEEKKNLELQLSAYTKRLDAARQTIATNEIEADAVEAKLLRLKAQVQTASEAAEPGQQTKWADGLRSDVQKAAHRIAGDRIAFEQSPTRAGLDALQSGCIKAVDVMSGSPLLASKVEQKSCDPGRTHEAATRLYALNGGANALGTMCGADKNPDSASRLEAQLFYVRSCLQYARLLPADAAAIRADINALERNRDDLAHRFVVTTNAFSDGNTLAYLALAIAIAIDSLVFMSGLFGATAARAAGVATPQDDRDAGPRGAAMIRSALLPDVFENAAFALEAVKPAARATNRGVDAEWTHEIDLNDCGSISQSSLRKTLNAAIAARVVESDPTRPDTYLLKPEFVEQLCDAAQGAFTSKQGNAGFSDLTLHAGTVLNYLHPSLDRDGFSYQLVMSEVSAEDLETVKRCLNAVAPLNCIRASGPESERVRYLIHKDLHRVLSFMSAGVAVSDAEMEDGSNTLLADRVVRKIEHRPAAPVRRRDPQPAADTPPFGKRPAMPPPLRGGYPLAEAKPTVVRSPASETPVGSVRSGSRNDPSDDPATAPVRPQIRTSRPSDTVRRN